MYRKILTILIIFVICIFNTSYAIEFAVPVWNELTEEVSAEALVENFLNIESESVIL